MSGPIDLGSTALLDALRNDEANWLNQRDWNIATARLHFERVVSKLAEHGYRVTEPRVLEGDWETVRDALDALPEGAQIRWRTGDPIHVALAIHRGAHWDATVYGGPLSSDNIARDETPIEVIA